MGFRDFGRRRLARQLGHPQGLFGRFVARQLNARNKPLMAACVAALDLSPGNRALDAGFGGGLGLQLLLDAVGPTGAVTGVDQSATAGAAARRRYGGRVMVHTASMTELPVDSESVDGAISVNTIYFLDDEALTAAVTEFARVLAPHGRLVLGVGDPDAMAKDPMMAFGFRVRPLTTLAAAAATAGLELVGHTRSRSGADAPHVLRFGKR